MVTVKIKAATPDDIAFIANNVRPEDRQELWASHRHTPEEAMSGGLKVSDYAITGFIDGNPVCMWGVASNSIIFNDGTPWMVGSQLLEKHAFTFLRRCKKPVAEMLTKYDYLYNYVDARNILAIKWLEWLGFNIEKEPTPYGISRLPFHKFTMRRN